MVMMVMRYLLHVMMMVMILMLLVLPVYGSWLWITMANDCILLDDDILACWIRPESKNWTDNYSTMVRVESA